MPLSDDQKDLVKNEVKTLMVGLSFQEQVDVLGEVLRESYPVDVHHHPLTHYATREFLVINLSQLSVEDRNRFIIDATDLYDELG